VDRARIEDEFRRKREALPVEYALSFRRWERVRRMQSFEHFAHRIHNRRSGA
jgi:hypothetical protein